MHEALTRASATQPCSGDKGGSSTRPQNKLIVSLYGSEDRCEMEKLGIRHRASLRSTTNAHSKGQHLAEDAAARGLSNDQVSARVYLSRPL